MDYFNEFTFIFVVTPLIIFGITTGITYFTNKAWIAPGITFLILLFCTFFVFNESFMIWTIIYTLFSGINSAGIYVLNGNLGVYNEKK